MELELQLRQAVMDAAARPEVRLAVELVYSDLQDAIDLRRPICATSGRCCRFEEFGHRLYVSTLELAKFMADGWAADPALPPNISQPARSAPAALPSVSLPVISTEVSDAQTSNTPPTTHNPQPTTSTPPGCPFQIAGLCTAHPIRPFGCRLFFCDATSTAWQHELYEQLHGQLRRLHDELAVPYHYVEWRFALRALGIIV